MAQMQFQSFMLSREQKKLWKKAARRERISASEFLRRALSERLKKTLSKTTQDHNAAGELRQ
jgi:hypothetical protein